ncbi:MAG: YbaN family protein [Burkholderiaceae bacterium]
MTPETLPAARRPWPAWLRGLLIAAGWLCVALGLLGVFLPLLPTTPFLLLAAACFARSSPRFHAWLLANRTFGPVIYQWEAKRTIPKKTKLIAIAMMLVMLSTSIVFFVRPLGLKLLLAALGLGLAVWMWRIPSERPPP